MPGRNASIAALLVFLLGACRSLDITHPREPSFAMPADIEGSLLARFTPALSLDGPESGFRLVTEGTDAFVIRALLATAARRTLDVQYYMIHADDTGRLLAEELLGAADRGVRVRVLVDDIYAHETDREIAILDHHPNIEIRLFNPWKQRGGMLSRAFGFLLEPGRLNHRMHNKMYIADNVALVIGGRNLGDEYFDLEDEFNFRDLDVLAVGAVVPQASRSFDRFWNSEWAVPAAALLAEAPTADDLEAMRRRLHEHREHMLQSPFVRALEESPLAKDFFASRIPLEIGRARIYGDEPDKVGSEAEENVGILEAGLDGHRIDATRELLITTAYFVPGDWGVEQLNAVAAKGVDVRVLTNSLAANDVPVVHSGYAKYRVDLLRGGVRLFEFRRATDAARDRKRRRLFGSENTSLHAKSIIVDRKSFYVGSLNLDPRSVRKNTEIGIIIESEALGQRLGSMFEYMTRPTFSYEAQLDDGPRGRSNDLVWLAEDDGVPVRHDTEPETSWFSRFSSWFVGLLPFVEEQI